MKKKFQIERDRNKKLKESLIRLRVMSIKWSYLGIIKKANTRLKKWERKFLLILMSEFNLLFIN